MGILVSLPIFTGRRGRGLEWNSESLEKVVSERI